MRFLFTLPVLLFFINFQAQSASIKGQLQDADGEAVLYANVALYSAIDSNLVKVESSNELGIFHLQGINAGNYFMIASYVGIPDLRQSPITLTADQQLDLGILSFAPAATDLEAVTVTAARAMVEIKPDRTVFNVQGTINSVGSDALNLLRKAPAVTVDNNDNVSVLGRTGVLLYVDGKRLPLTGDDLSSYLQNLPAEQIDRMDIITNPGARYEAEGNAGIIDIILKKDKNMGGNGSLNGTFSQGQLHRGNINASANYRNKKFNAFGQGGFGDGAMFNDMVFDSYQNNLRLEETNYMENEWQNFNGRVGMDFFLSKKHTLGFLLSGGSAMSDRTSRNRIAISRVETPNQPDSILVADNTADNQRSQKAANLNYRFDMGKGRSLNVDLDYGQYENDSKRFQPNRYFDSTEETLLSQNINSFDTPTDIKIYTFKVDFEEDLWGGKLGLGSKLSRVESDNIFLVFDNNSGTPILDNSQSNEFYYDENVYAGYVSFARPINEKWNFIAGLRAEQTDATGDLQAYDPDKEEDPVDLNYLSWFPNAGLTWSLAPKHSLALNYGRRINRPDYNVLNPFRNRLSEISYERGNPRLNPEIVNNVELGYTLAYRYNFKLGYSRTEDQITRLIGPDEDDPRANFISWENLTEQTVISFNISAPVQINKWWNAYFNFSASRLDNQAVYEDGGIVDLQAFTYSIYQQHTFNLPASFKGEISGYYSGPGVWGGVFEYDPSWSLNVGLQRKFLQDRLNVRINFSDIFYESWWSGTSVFNGLVSSGRGLNDTRRGSLSVSYNFGNQNVKSRKRKTGLEEEADRVGGN